MKGSIKRPIVLVGMMGSGKSTIGKRLAYKLNLQFYDSDKLIENREGLSVLDIYDYRGEEYFKKQEQEVIAEVLRYGTVVLSTGGESFLNEKVRDLVKEKAISVWLRTNVEVMQERISRRNTRPIQANNIDAIEKMVKDAEEIYKGVDIEVDSGNIEAHFIVDTILSKIRNLTENSSPII